MKKLIVLTIITLTFLVIQANSLYYAQMTSSNIFWFLLSEIGIIFMMVLSHMTGEQHKDK